MDSLEKALHRYIQDPKNPELNFELGYEYDVLGQTASAFSLYLRTSERTDDDDLIYECLLRNAKCFSRQDGRPSTELGQILHAIQLIPTRPEAHYIHSCYHSWRGNWQESYTAATFGIMYAENAKPFKKPFEYPGLPSLKIQKALSGWYIGRGNESREIYNSLLEDKSLDPSIRSIVENNFKNLPGKSHQPQVYVKDYHEKLKVKFKNSDKIQRNYSQTYQDMFVLTMLNGKENGTYLEIGSANPFYGNNTALLEGDFNWKGISIDIDQAFVNDFNSQRKNKCVQADATEVDYAELLNKNLLPKDIDYLQVDCDPVDITYKILQRIPFDTHRFAVITFEHDYYADVTKSYRDLSRKFLKEKGYVLAVSNIAPNSIDSFEDWYIHPELVDRGVLRLIKNASDQVKSSDYFMLNKTK